jgi:hypothetical protein
LTKHGIEVRGVEIEHVSGDEDAGVVHYHVDPSEAVLHRLEAAVHLGTVGDVCRDDECLRTLCAHELGHLIEYRSPAGDQRYPRPGRAEGERGGASDAAGCPGDDDRLAAKAFEPGHDKGPMA